MLEVRVFKLLWLVWPEGKSKISALNYLLLFHGVLGQELADRVVLKLINVIDDVCPTATIIRFNFS